MGWTMDRLAKAVGLKTYQTVALWETDGGTAPTRTRMPKVAQALGCSEEWLRTGKDDGNELSPLKQKWINLLEDLSSEDIQEFFELVSARQEKNRKFLRDRLQYEKKMRTLPSEHSFSEKELQIIADYRAAGERGKLAIESTTETVKQQAKRINEEMEKHKKSA